MLFITGQIIVWTYSFSRIQLHSSNNHKDLRGFWGGLKIPGEIKEGADNICLTKLFSGS